MKILLINPPVIASQERKIGSVTKSLFYNSPPLGLCYLAAVLEKNKFTVKIIDAAVENLEISQIRRRFNKFKPDIVGITATVCSFQSAIDIAKMVKAENPSVKVIIGGPQITANPKLISYYKCFDLGVIGEGEVTLLKLVNALENRIDLGKVKGIVFRDGRELCFTSPRDYLKNLDELPFPARHLLSLGLYLPQPNDERDKPKFSMITSRGCPFGCIFCDKCVFGSQYRTFSPEYIASEMEHLVSDFGAKDIAFVDSCFTQSKERVESIIAVIRKRKINVSWTCSTRVDIVTKDLLKAMKDAGCWRVRLGVESGDDKVLKFINKGITTQQVINAANWAAEVGLQPKGFFMIGHLIDTKESIEKTIKFAKSLPLKDITVQINTPLKNTPQYKIYKKYGVLVTNDYSKFSYFESVYIPYGLTKRYLDRVYFKFYRSWYLRPVVFWRHIKSLRGFKDLSKYVKAFSLLLFLFFGRNIRERFISVK